MDKPEKQIRYLALYRQQLKRETDVMGYDKSQYHILSPERRSPINWSSSLAIAALVLTMLGLASAQL